MAREESKLQYISLVTKYDPQWREKPLDVTSIRPQVSSNQINNKLMFFRKAIGQVQLGLWSVVWLIPVVMIPYQMTRRH